MWSIPNKQQKVGYLLEERAGGGKGGLPIAVLLSRLCYAHNMCRKHLAVYVFVFVFVKPHYGQNKKLKLMQVSYMNVKCILILTDMYYFL
jgi:hypothetical protein